MIEKADESAFEDRSICFSIQHVSSPPHTTNKRNIRPIILRFPAGVHPE